MTALAREPSSPRSTRILAVARVLAATVEAARNTDDRILARLSDVAGAYLRNRPDVANAHDVAASRPDFAGWILARAHSHIWKAWRSSDGETRDPSDEDLDQIATTFADDLIVALTQGYAQAEIRAELPDDAAARLREVAAAARKPLASADTADPFRAAVAMCKAGMRAVGYPEKRVKTLFDSHRKRRDKIAGPAARRSGNAR